MVTNKKEKGQAIYLIVFGIVALIGSAALAIDGGRIYLDRREVQNTADSAVLAAALTDCTSSGDLLIKARAIAAANGYDHNDPDVSVDVYHPPVSGPYTGDSDYYEVVIQTFTETGLAQLVKQGSFPVEARAVALCEEGTGGSQAVGEGNALISLKTSGSEGLKSSSNGDVIVHNGGIHVNSSDSKAIKVSSNGDVIADVITVVGGYKHSGNGEISPTPITGVSVMDDPLASLAPPTNPYSGSCVNYSLSGNNNDTIGPGLYCNIALSGNGDLYLESGTYVIDGGTFKLSGNGDITASSSGVQLILINGANLQISGNGDCTLKESFVYIESGSYKLSGNGDMTIDAPSSGEWAGMALFMDQNNSSEVKLSGNGDIKVEGTMYGASAHFELTGNGDSFTFNAQVIGKDIKTSGNGDMVVNYLPGELFQDPNGGDAKISLVE